MPSSDFRITPTPPISLEVEAGKDGVFSFTVDSLAAPDKVVEIMPKALLLDNDGKSKEADWLVAGPKPTLSISGGETTTITIAVKPKLAMPPGEYRIKLVIAEKGRPNDVYAESSPVFCQVTPSWSGPRKRSWWLIPVIAGGVLVLGGGGVLAWWFLKPPPVAVASGEPLSGHVPLTVSFRNTSTGKPSQVEWNFGDGSPISDESNPTHEYKTPATYNVELTVKDKRGRTSTAVLVVKADPPTPPGAAASGEPLSGRAPLTVKFQNKSTGRPSKLEWQFGDGSPISTETNPTHTYRTPGTHTVVLTATDSYGGATTARLTVKVEPHEGPVAAASGTPLTGRIPLTVKFTNKSTGNPTRVQWSFGDGSPTSTESNPTHIYQRPGSYTVSLTAWDSEGASSATQLAVKAEPPPPPVAAAVGTPLVGRIPLTVRFTNRSTGNPSRVEWSFGDDSPISTESNPSHTYQRPGSYSVTLTAKDNHGGSSTFRLAVKADPPVPPVAVASGTPLTGRIPLTVRFTNRSTGNPSRVEWSFGDGSPISTESNPSHTYQRAGSYVVTLTAKDSWGGFTTFRLTVKADPPPPAPVARFEPSVREGKWPLQVVFTNTSQNAIPGTQWSWRFGDGATSSAQSPPHRFDNPGEYKVHLRVSNANGSSETETVIRVLPRRGELAAERVGPFGGTWGNWAGQFQRCPETTLAYGFEDKVEPSQGGGDDTALNGIKLWCVRLPDLQSNNYITSNQGGWGNWSERMDCRDRKSYLVGARLRIEPPQGSGDDTGGVDVEFSCSSGAVLSNGGHKWGAWKDWRYCPANTAICGIRTRIEPSQGGGDDTALNDVELQCCYVK